MVVIASRKNATDVEWLDEDYVSGLRLKSDTAETSVNVNLFNFNEETNNTS